MARERARASPPRRLAMVCAKSLAKRISVKENAEIRKFALCLSALRSSFLGYLFLSGSPFVGDLSLSTSRESGFVSLPASAGGEASARRWRTICQRCNSGKRLKDGMPRSGLPFVIFQKRVPSVCCWTAGRWKSAAFFKPRPSSPWHSAQ